MFTHIDHHHGLRAHGGHHGRRPGGGGRFGGGRGRHGMGGSGFRAGRMLSAADLQLIIMALLAERARHGYEIIKAIQERTSGSYSPSPGMVYPALTFLEDLGHAKLEADGAKKSYSLTESGREAVRENQARIDTVFAELRRIGQKLELARRAFEGATEALATDRLALATLDEARRNLKAALLDAYDASPEEQQRIAAVLQRTIDEIRCK
ncbi:MAG: PadR family transcriptional regulator [Gammaproteobacteria bacterium]|nr:PadR family transcriptional regulator [Gammaproteobacteria bacterium]